jgi:hypothetical protein
MSTKSKTILTLIIVAFLAALLVIFLIYPTYTDIANNSQELILEKQKMKALEEKIGNIQYFRDNSEQIEANISKASEFFAASDAPVNFITFLERIAKESQTSMEIVPSVPVEDEKLPWEHITFRIATVSTFPNFLKFLDKLESGPYLIKIENLQIKRLNASALKVTRFEGFSVGDASASITLKVYAN